MRLILIIAVLLGSATAKAVPVQWVLDEIDVGSGFTASGTFTLDVDNKYTSIPMYSDINVLVSDGTLLQYTDPGGWYTCCNGPEEFSDSGQLYLTDVAEDDLPIVDDGGIPHPDWTGQKQLAIVFSADLTNAGGTIPIFLTYAALCDDSSCGSRLFGQEVYNSGVVTAIPIPAAVWLFGSGLGLLGWFRRRQTA